MLGEWGRRIMQKNIESKILIGRYRLECLDFCCGIILKVKFTGIVLRMWCDLETGPLVIENTFAFFCDSW